MAELVDALDSKSSGGNIVGVRVPPPVPRVKSDWIFLSLFFYACSRFSFLRQRLDGYRLLAGSFRLFLNNYILLLFILFREGFNIRLHFASFCGCVMSFLFL